MHLPGGDSIKKRITSNLSKAKKCKAKKFQIKLSALREIYKNIEHIPYIDKEASFIMELCSTVNKSSFITIEKLTQAIFLNDFMEMAYKITGKTDDEMREAVQQELLNENNELFNF